MSTNADDMYFRAWVLARQASYATSRAADIELNKLGTSLAEIQILYVLKHYRGPMTPSTLSHLLVRRPNSVSGILIRMERRGLLRRLRDQQDQRVVIVEITNKGESVFNQRMYTPVISRIMSNLSEEELLQFSKVTQVIYEAAIRELRRQKARSK